MTKRAAQATGRPSIFTQALAETITARMGEGESLRSICRDVSMPGKTTVLRWLADNEAFRSQYAHARELQADALFDEMLEIADTPEEGEERTVKADGGIEVRTGDMLGHRKLRVDARKWMIGKLAPKKYGEKLALEHSGELSLSQLVEASFRPRHEEPEPAD